MQFNSIYILELSFYFYCIINLLHFWSFYKNKKKKKRGTNPLSRLSFFYRTQTIVAIKSY